MEKSIFSIINSTSISTGTLFSNVSENITSSIGTLNVTNILNDNITSNNLSINNLTNKKGCLY